MNKQVDLVSNRLEKWLASLGLIVLTWLVYYRVGGFEFVDIDDPTYIRDNPTVLDGLTRSSFSWAWTSSYFSNWHPVTTTTWLIDIELFGVSASQMHVANLLWHTANVLLVYHLFLRLTGSSNRSLLVAALFAVHPQHVESVAWISSRKDVLFAFFGLASLHFYFSYVNSNKWFWYTLSLCAYAASLLSKQMLVTLPCLLLLLDFYPLNRLNFAPHLRATDSEVSLGTQPVPLKKVMLEKVPFGLLAVAFSLLILAIQSEQGSVASGEDFSLSERLARVIVAYREYLQHFVWPSGLSVFYPFEHDGPSFFDVAMSALLLLTISILCLWKNCRQPWMFSGWFWFVGTMVPVVGIIQIGWQRIADRYTYFPMIGLYFGVVWLLAESFQRWSKVKFALATCWLFVLALLSYQQVAVWRNAITLFEHAVECNPHDAKVHTSFGWSLFQRDQIEKAREQFKQAVEITPENPEAHSSLADFYHRQGNEELALHHHHIAIELGSEILKVQYDAGSFFLDVQLIEEAVICFQRASRLPGKPSLRAQALNDLGIIRFQEGDFKTAAERFEQALAEGPDRQIASEIVCNQGILSAAQSQFGKALRLLDSAIELNPDNSHAHFYRGRLLIQEGNVEQGATALKLAAELNSDFLEAGQQILLELQGQE